MASSAATTVEEYLDELPAERRAVVTAVRDLIVSNLPDGYQETINWGMICYEIPLEQYPNTYNRQPLQYIALAAQKNYYALYLSGVYGDEQQQARLADAFRSAGKRLDMGKSCLRFRKLDDVPWPIIEQLVSSTSPQQYIARYEAARRQR